MGLKEHLNLFPLRIGKALASFPDWTGVSEIRLRREKPLSLTHFKGNIFLDEKGRECSIGSALRTREEEIRAFVCSFCKGSVYRYFDTLKDGFLVDDEGYRLGVCPEKGTGGVFLPERFEGVNLRIPRQAKGAATEFLHHFSSRPLASTLILSPPGAGKTTLLRDLAIQLSRGWNGHRALRTCVIDERRELFPPSFLSHGGLCDVLTGYPKGEGITIATGLFSPEVILCDEIGGKEEADAILSACNSGCLFFATAHASSKEEAERRPFLRSLLSGGVFSLVAVLLRLEGTRYRSTIQIQEIC